MTLIYKNIVREREFVKIFMCCNKCSFFTSYVFYDKMGMQFHQIYEICIEKKAGNVSKNFGEIQKLPVFWSPPIAPKFSGIVLKSFVTFPAHIHQKNSLNVMQFVTPENKIKMVFCDNRI